MYQPFVNRVLKKIFDISNSSENLYIPGSPWAQGADSPYQVEMARRAKRGRDAGPKGLRGFECRKFRSTLNLAAYPLRLLGSAANPYCPANFERRADLPQLFQRSYLQPRRPATGGAYQSARRVTACARSNYKFDACQTCTRSTHQTVTSAPFLPYLFRQGGKDGAAGGMTSLLNRTPSSP